MQNSALNSSFVGRLKEILNSRYGKGLQIRQLLDLGEWQSGDCYSRGKDLHIPIQVNGTCLGTAVIPAADDLCDDKKAGVTQLVRMVLEPAMYKWYLEQKETNLVEINKMQNEFSNIHSLHEKLFPVVDPIKIEKLPTLNDGLADQLISQIIHLEGQSSFNNKKVALLLHELTSRWAFVPYQDIKEHLHSVHDFPKLGAMTIFVENIEDITQQEQELLLEYVTGDHSFEEPLIVTSSAKNLQELAKFPVVSDLVDELSVNCFDVDRAPLNNENLKDVLELFFFRDAPLDA